jgi:hypothetical protein
VAGTSLAWVTNALQTSLYHVRHGQNPLLALKLALLRLGTLLRPGTRIYPPASLGGMVKVFLALAIPFWLITPV